MRRASPHIKTQSCPQDVSGHPNVGFPIEAFGNDTKRKSTLHSTILLACLVMTLTSGCGRKNDSGQQQNIAALDKSEWVGSQACMSCHEMYYTNYMKTGMGRSFMLYDSAAMSAILKKPVTVYHEQSDYYYDVFFKTNKVMMREYRKEKGRVTHELELAAAYQVGSGNNTISFIADHNGYLFEMPLTWYSNKKIWDMSPGYHENNLRFFRPINQTCMNCHTASSPVTPQTENHFKQVELGIACETCHGAGKQHVKLAESSSKDKTELRKTILNSADWSRDLQMDLCQRCHLEGLTVWNDKHTADNIDIRRPLAAHKAVFVSSTSHESETEFNIAAQADRLRKSECFIQSETMTCTTCHDPHRTSTTMSAGEFNATCQSCHKFAAEHTLCSFPRSNNNCISCHMKTSGTRDIPHVLFTDHYIRRNIETPVKTFETPTPTAPALIPMLWSKRYPEQLQQKGLAYFQYYQTAVNAPVYVDSMITFLNAAAREGIQRTDGEDDYALSVAYMIKSNFPASEQAASRATARNPDHARAWYIIGEANYAQGRLDEAVLAYNRGIQSQPLLLENSIGLLRTHLAAQRFAEAATLGESILLRDSLSYPNVYFHLGDAYQYSGRGEPARGAYQRALALDPDFNDARMGLGASYLLENDWNRAIAEFDRILIKFPNSIPALMNKTLALANAERKKEALALARRILQLNPTNERAKMMLNDLTQPGM